MRDALGAIKVGHTEDLPTRICALQYWVSRERRPVTLVRAIEVPHGAMKRVEFRAFRLLRQWRVSEVQEWFATTAAVATRKINEARRQIAREAPYLMEFRWRPGIDVIGDTPGTRKAMLSVVREQLMRSHRGLAISEAARRGPKALTLDKLQEAKAEAIWRNVRRYPRWEDVEAALKEQIHTKFTRWRAHRMFGPRHVGEKREAR